MERRSYQVQYDTAKHLLLYHDMMPDYCCVSTPPREYDHLIYQILLYISVLYSYEYEYYE